MLRRPSLAAPMSRPQTRQRVKRLLDISPLPFRAFRGCWPPWKITRVSADRNASSSSPTPGCGQHSMGYPTFSSARAQGRASDSRHGTQGSVRQGKEFTMLLTNRRDTNIMQARLFVCQRREREVDDAYRSFHWQHVSDESIGSRIPSFANKPNIVPCKVPFPFAFPLPCCWRCFIYIPLFFTFPRYLGILSGFCLLPPPVLSPIIADGDGGATCSRCQIHCTETCGRTD